MPNRRRRAATIACQVAVVVLLTSRADAQPVDRLGESEFVVETERYTPESGAAVDLRYLTARGLAGQAPRLITATRASLKLLQDWFGPLPAASLSVAGVRWHAAVNGTSAPGMVTTPLRWLAPERDQSMERALIGAIVRQYFVTDAPASRTFTESLVIYTATRAVHHLLEVTNFAAPRFLGGMVPFPLRSLLLSPPASDPRPRVLGFEELEISGRPDHLRGVRALQSLERYVGWPTMLETISRLRNGDPAAWDETAFAETLSEVRGTDLRALVKECFTPDAVFDYAIGDMHSRDVAPGQVETTITVVRRGAGRFAIGDGHAGDGAIAVRSRFADGREVRDLIDGAAPAATLIYTAPVPAVSAGVDPDVMLLLDADRENNSVVRDARTSKLGVRLALHWLAWLQNAMLSYTALL